LSLLDRYSDYFETSDYQFGFKKQLSCSHVVYSVRSVIESYVANGSTVNLCALDLSKAFDRMNHFALFIRLMERNFPVEILKIIENWFSISETCVRWEGNFSYFFKLAAGTRQGGILSPTLFAIFIDRIIDRVLLTNVGCYKSNICVSIFLYADDILLLAHTVTGLQMLVDACENELNYLDMRLNVKKSVCLRIGNRFNIPCADIISMHGGALQWVNSCKYLGMYFISGRLFRCSYSRAKNSFFRSFNSILGKVGRAASEEVVLSLLKTKCLPCLLYGVEACPVLKRDKDSFDFTLTRSLMKLFRTGSPNVIIECQKQFDFLPLRYQIDVRTARFLHRYVNCDNALCRLFSCNASNNLQSIFACYGDSVTNVFELKLNVKKKILRKLVFKRKQFN
jgi:hypothetical protein